MKDAAIAASGTTQDTLLRATLIEDSPAVATITPNLHDWVASEGSFVYEPPGEIHTLVIDEGSGGVPEMITFFNIHRAMVYVDEAGKQTGYEDVFTKIAMCRQHYAANGLGESYIDQFVR